MENFMVKHGKRLRALIGMGMALPLSMSLAVCTWLPTPSPTAANRTSAALFSTLFKGNTSIAEIKIPALFLAADAEKIISHYWLNKIYPPEIGEAHSNGDYHIRDRGTLGAYCVGWDLKDLLLLGFKGVSGKIEI